MLLAVTVFVALNWAALTASTAPPETVTVAALFRIALATAASTVLLSSDASSGTVVSVDVTVDLASTLRLAPAWTTPLEMFTAALDRPMANAAFTEPRLKLLSVMVIVDSASSEMLPAVLRSSAPAVPIVMRLSAVKSRPSMPDSPEASFAVDFRVISPLAMTLPVTVMSFMLSSVSELIG